MPYAPKPWAAATMNVTANTTTEAIDLGRVFDLLAIDVPAVNTCSISLKACRTLGGTYNTLGSSTPAVNVGAGSVYEMLNLGGMQYVKLFASVNQSASRTFYYMPIAT